MKLNGEYIAFNSNVIPAMAFAQCKNLEKIIIHTRDGEPIKSVGDSTFAGCPKLTSLDVTISYDCDLGKDIFKGSGVSHFNVGPSYNQGISGSTQEKLNEQKIKTKKKKTTVPAKNNTGGGSSSSSTPNTKNVSDGSVNKEKTDTNQDIVINGITWTYTLKDGKATKVKPKTKENKATVNIPDKIEEHTVISIGANAFEGWDNLTSVTIPKTVTKIEKEAFKDCTKLGAINLPKKLITIGDYAFQRCTSLTKITIKKNVISIGEGAFKGCSGLGKVRIKGSKTNIGKEAFKNCSNLTKAIFYKKQVELRNRCICRVFSITCYLRKKELSCKNLCG